MVGRLIGAGIGAIIGGAKGKRDGDAMAALQEKEAELRWLATQEEVRRMEVTHEEILGQARADVGASGFMSSSESHAAKIGQVEEEFRQQRNIALTMGEMARDIGMESAGLTRKSSRMSGILSGLSTGAGIGDWFS